jgi:hypothetical protein
MLITNKSINDWLHCYINISKTFVIKEIEKLSKKNRKSKKMEKILITIRIEINNCFDKSVIIGWEFIYQPNNQAGPHN